MMLGAACWAWVDVPTLAPCSRRRFDPTKPQHTGCAMSPCGETEEGVKYHELMGRRVAEMVNTVAAA